jgi:glycosyltransferase involved in cell wall biosynthesis
MPELVRLDPRVRLRIVGTGPWEGELRALAEASPVASHIEIGAVDATDRRQLADLISRAALVALMGEYESQGIAVLEALGQGRRVVVADTSALSEYAHAGVARAVSVDATPEQLARAMHEEITGPARPPFSLPTWDQCAERLGTLYGEVLAQ